MRTTLLGILVLVVGAWHLAIVLRALLDPAWLYDIVVTGAASFGELPNELEAALVETLGLLSIVGAIAVVCAIGLLRRLNAARVLWLAAAFPLVLGYGIAFALYAYAGATYCATTSAVMVVTALLSLMHFFRAEVKLSFTRQPSAV